MTARVQRLDDLDPIAVAGVNWRPLRRALGITAFGTNAYTADAGEMIVEPHDEAGGHEEMYVVITGSARFEVAGEAIDAGPGTVVFLSEPGDRREATATADGTTVLAVGGMPGTITPSAWEYRFAAARHREAGDHDRAYEVCAEGFAHHPDDPAIHYELACSAALGGRPELAQEHLRKAVAGDPWARERAWTDEDLASVREVLD